jgi:hypothetical protein
VKTVLHLVRPGAVGSVPPVVAESDWVVYLQSMVLVQAGMPHTAPFPPGLLDHDQVVVLTFAADLVVTW